MANHRLAVRELESRQSAPPRPATRGLSLVPPAVQRAAEPVAELAGPPSHSAFVQRLAVPRGHAVALPAVTHAGTAPALAAVHASPCTGCGSGCPHCTVIGAAEARTGDRPVQRSAADDLPAATIHAAAAAGVRTPATAMPHLAAIQGAFGRHSLAGVRAHLGERATASAAAMDAAAFTTGADVVFARPPDLHTAAHEAAHVVQQRGGISLSGNAGRVGDPWERHADAVADAVVAGRSAEPLLDATAPQRAAREPTAPVQRGFLSGLGKAFGGLLGVIGGAAAVALSPLIGLGAGAYMGYKAAKGSDESGWGTFKGILGGFGGALVGTVAGPLAAALSVPVGMIYGGIKGAGYAEGQSGASRFAHGLGGALAGAVAPLSVGALAGASLLDPSTRRTATQATRDRVTLLAQGYGITLAAPGQGAGPWLEEELLGIEQALTVYDAILAGRTTQRSLALALDQGEQAWNLRGTNLNRIAAKDNNRLDMTNAYASPEHGVTVCGDHLVKQLGSQVFTAEMQKGVFVHELGHALLKHELLPFHREIDTYLAGQGRRNLWQIDTDNHGPSRSAHRDGNGIEYPITAYGGATPDEDMCETLRFYFQSATTRATLRARAPGRFHAIERIVAENLRTVALDPHNAPGPTHYSDERGQRQTAQVTQAELNVIGQQIAAVQQTLPQLQQNVDALQQQYDASEAVQTATWLRTQTQRNEVRRLLEPLGNARRALAAAQQRLAALQGRLARLQSLLAGQMPHRAHRSNPTQHDALSGYGASKYSARLFWHSLPF